MISPFGIDHGYEISKAKKKKDDKINPGGAAAATAGGAIAGSHVGGMVASGGPRKYVDTARRMNQASVDAVMNSPRLFDAAQPKPGDGTFSAMRRGAKVGREVSASALKQVPEFRRAMKGSRIGMGVGAAGGLSAYAAHKKKG